MDKVSLDVARAAAKADTTAAIAAKAASDTATYVPKNRDSVNARDFGVVPSSGTTTSAWTDVTTAFQAAIDYCVTNGIGRLYVPAGNYLVNGTITIGAPLLIEGSFGVQMKNLSNALSGGGTVISTTGGTAGNFVFNFTPAAPATNTWGVGIRNITFYGLATGSAVDRPCIRLDHVWSELYIENVNIFGFNRQGLVSQNSQDGTVLNVTILACGLDPSGSYASLDLLSNTNALHFAGLHIENTPYHLHVGNGARHNQFVDCKFEQYAKPAAATWSPIWIDTTYENAFLGCQFVQDSTNDTYFYTDSTVQPPFIKVTGSNTHAVFTGCMFTTAEQTRQSTAGTGGRWLIVSTPATVQVAGCSFSSVYTGAGAYPIVLSDYCVFTNNKLKTYTDGTTRQIVQMGQRNIIAGNVFLNQDTNAVTAGAIFNCTGQRNTFTSNEILGNYSAILAGQAYQSISEALRSSNTTVSGATPNVGWAEPGASQIYLVTNPGTTIMTGMVGIPQREVTLLFTNTNTTLKGTGSTFALRGGIDVTPPSYSIMRFWYDGGTWWEISRNFSTATDSAVQSVAGRSGVITLAKSDVGLSNVDNTSDTNKPVSSAQAAINAAKADLVAGLIPTSQIPSLALNTVVPVASRAAMLALTNTQVQPGDVAVDSSAGATRGSYMLAGTDPSQIGNWILLNAPADAVSTINGQTGTVVLAAGDVGADPAGAAAAAQSASAQKTANLADLADVPTARTNLGLGSASTQPSSAFDAAGAATAAQAAAVQRGNHTGTQPASTVTGLAAVATTGAYSDLSGRPATNAGAFATIGNFSAPGGNLGTTQLSEGVVKGAVLQAGRTGNVDQLAVNVTTAGTTGALVRLGLYSVDLTTNACTLVADGGTIDATTTGAKTVAVTGAAITKGTYYVLTATCQGAATTRPSVQTITSADALVSNSDAGTVLANSLAGLQIAAGVSGALPTTATGAGAVGVPRIAGRAA